MSTPTQSREEELQRKLDRLRRRQGRNERAAWASGFLTAVCGMLKPGDVAIDCGANVGDISKRLLASGADVIAFDPEPWAVEKLRAPNLSYSRRWMRPICLHQFGVLLQRRMKANSANYVRRSQHFGKISRKNTNRNMSIWTGFRRQLTLNPDVPETTAPIDLCLRRIPIPELDVCVGHKEYG